MMIEKHLPILQTMAKKVIKSGVIHKTMVSHTLVLHMTDYRLSHYSLIYFIWYLVQQKNATLFQTSSRQTKLWYNEIFLITSKNYGDLITFQANLQTIRQCLECKEDMFYFGLRILITLSKNWREYCYYTRTRSFHWRMQTMEIYFQIHQHCIHWGHQWIWKSVGTILKRRGTILWVWKKSFLTIDSEGDIETFYTHTLRCYLPKLAKKLFEEYNVGYGVFSMQAFEHKNKQSKRMFRIKSNAKGNICMQ